MSLSKSEIENVPAEPKEFSESRESRERRETNPATSLAWLSEVEEVGPPEKSTYPIWVKRGSVRTGSSTVRHPHRHPFCELSLQLRGSGVLHVGHESVARRAGDLLLMGAQVPHWYQIASQPLEYVNIYFFPMALMNWVSPEVSILLLQRFAAEHPLAQRNIHLPGSLLHEFTQVFCAAATEFEARRLGWELHLQASLVHCLVTLARWERGLRGSPKPVARRVYWDRLERVLQHLRERHAEPVYVHDLALLAGMSESSLNAMFQATLGMTWVKYLQAFRVQRSLALLAQPGETIASVAYSVGFESISHFNTTFRSLMGMSPKELLKKQSNFS